MEKTAHSPSIDSSLCQLYLLSFALSGNAMWAWISLRHWLTAPEQQESGSFPLPDDLRVYLVDVSNRIIELAKGRIPPAYRNGRPIPVTGVQRPLTVSEATDMFPEALQMRGDRWNAFTEFRRHEKSADVMEAQLRAILRGDQKAEARKAMEAAAEVSDERTLRRILKGVGRRQKKSPFKRQEK